MTTGTQGHRRARTLTATELWKRGTDEWKHIVVYTLYGILLSLKEERHSGLCSYRGEVEDMVLREINQTQMV